MRRIGIDAGGTFTDAVLWDEESGLLSSAKVSSRKDDPAGAVLAAAQRVVELGPDDANHTLRDLVHGTTIGTNVSLERNGPRTALLTTRGFRDVLEIGRLTRPASALYDLLDPGPSPLVARRDRFEVPERLDRDGSVHETLDEEAVAAAARTLAARGIPSIAVSFLYSHVNPAHERRAREIIHEHAPGVEVSLSSDVLPQVREFERTATTVLNAYLKPVCAPYLDELTGRLASWNADIRTWIMQSNGGVTSPRRAASSPVNLLMSGPSGGVVAGRLIAQQTGLADTITVDMGGTSFDVCLIADATVPLSTHSTSMDLPVKVPTVDIETIGTGGGSVAHVDSGGQFLVGPASAGARPGPAAYGRGGTEPTVTDANVVLGVLQDGTLLGDDVVIDRSAALAACARLGLRLGLDPIETALGIRRISNAAMAGAVRAATVGRGHDPRRFALNAFGGAGPMHATDIAEELAIPTVIVPPVAGVLSAVGLVVSDVVHNHGTSHAAPMSPQAEATVGQIFADLERRATEQLTDEGVRPTWQTLVRALDLHYAGQNSTITVPLDGDDRPGWAGRLVERFHRMHEQVNGFRVETEPVHVAVVRVTGVGRTTVEDPAPRSSATSSIAPSHGTRLLTMAPGDALEVPRFRREDLLPGQFFTGAAVVDSADTTVVVPPRSRTRIDDFGNMLIHLEARS
ncbi:hydantoinase/oxoprolinase family protein [Aeromicrobium alkaliterrae]|uniref:Hydantoinase/oxoprolinase family protein n=1 Tax=Aeromicrobium alkaliterrae TaxID=302168 RepID=A0ABP4VS79_9ACTN